MPHPYEDDEDPAGTPRKGHNSVDAVGDELLQYIERVEQLAVEMADLKDQEKEVFSEAKARGFDTKTMRKIIKMRKQSADERAEEQMLLDTYLSAIGML